MRRLLLFASAIVFVDTMFFAAVVPLLPRLTDDFELSKSAAGILSGAYAAGTLAASVPAGLLASRIGVRPTLLAGLGLLTASGVVFATANNIVLLDIARFAQGIGGACSWAGALGWLIGAAPRERRGELIGSAMAAAIGGVLFGPVLGGAAVAFGRGPVFGAVAVLGLGMIALTRRLPVPAPSTQDSVRASLAAAVTAPGLRLGLVLILIPGLLFGTVDVLVPLRLDELGAGAGAIAAVFIIAALTEAAVNPIAGRLSDRHGRIAPSKVGLAASTVAALVLILPETAAVLGVVMILAAPAIGILWSPAIAMLSDSAEGAGVPQGLAFGFVNLGWALGHTIGAAGGPALADATSDAVTYALLAVIAAFALAALIRRDPRAEGVGFEPTRPVNPA
jgi:MFS family permease